MARRWPRPAGCRVPVTRKHEGGGLGCRLESWEHGGRSPSLCWFDGPPFDRRLRPDKHVVPQKHKMLCCNWRSTRMRWRGAVPPSRSEDGSAARRVPNSADSPPPDVRRLGRRYRASPTDAAQPQRRPLQRGPPHLGDPRPHLGHDSRRAHRPNLGLKKWRDSPKYHKIRGAGCCRRSGVHGPTEVSQSFASREYVFVSALRPSRSRVMSASLWPPKTDRLLVARPSVFGVRPGRSPHRVWGAGGGSAGWGGECRYLMTARPACAVGAAQRRVRSGGGPALA